MPTTLHPIDHPDQFAHPQFLFIPLHPKHVHLDYQAVMNTKSFLRLWSNSTWPSDNFTLEENLKDLEWHHQDHLDGTAYTYTILHPSQNLCLGCIYINPPERIQDLTAQEKKKIESLDAICTYWVTAALIQQELEGIIFQNLIQWLNTDWQFKNLAFANNPNTTHQAELFKKNGLQFYLSLTDKNRYQNLWIIKGK